MFSNILVYIGYAIGYGLPGKKTRTGTGMGKNLNSHVGMGFLAGRVRVGGCGYGTALPDGFLPVAISNHMSRLTYYFKINKQASSDVTAKRATPTCVSIGYEFHLCWLHALSYS
jgi:hypothetical protein